VGLFGTAQERAAPDPARTRRQAEGSGVRTRRRLPGRSRGTAARPGHYRGAPAQLSARPRARPAASEASRPPPALAAAEFHMFFIFYAPDTWDPDVIEIVRNMELYKTVFEISDPQWSFSTVELRGSAALELFLQSWRFAKHTLNIPITVTHSLVCRVHSKKGPTL
jgi:hypothetical protein